jgi:hypothetical protein
VFRRIVQGISTLADWKRHLCFRALDHALHWTLRTMLKRQKIGFPDPSESGCLLPIPADVIHFAAINANSGSVEGTYQTHDHLFGSELNWDIENSNDANSVFRQHLQLVCGDQKTVENIQFTKIDQEDSHDAYCTRRWLLPIPGLFHVQMNLAGVLLRENWTHTEVVDSQELMTRHALLPDIQYLGYKGLSPERAPWHVLDNLITVSFNARVMAVWLQCLETTGHINRNDIITDKQLHEFVASSVEKPAFEKSMSMAESILFSTAALEGRIPEEVKDYTASDSFPWPSHMIVLARFTQVMHYYLMLRYSIKYGNTSALRTLLPFVMLLFLGSKKNKCAREVMYLVWLLEPSTSNKSLSDAILQSLLINSSGRKDAFIPLDRRIEHDNSGLQHDINAHKNSTHDWTTILQSYARIVPSFIKIRDLWEHSVQYKISNKHSARDTSIDVFSMAFSLWKENHVDWTIQHPRQLVCEHVIAVGAAMLPVAITAFNRDVVDKQSGRFTGQFEGNDVEGPEVIIDKIDQYNQEEVYA